MDLSSLPFFGVLRAKMDWHNVRSGVLAENVANADTPGYEAKDVGRPDFDALLRAAREEAGVTGARRESFEPESQGHPVLLEEEMMKVSDNAMQYQTAMNLYAKGLGLIRTALGR